MKKILITFVMAMVFYGTQAQDTVRYPDRWYGYTPREALMEYTGKDTTVPQYGGPIEHRWFDSSIHTVRDCHRPGYNVEPIKHVQMMRYVYPGVNQKMYGIAITMYPADFDTLDGSLVAYCGVNSIANSNDDEGIFYKWNVDTIFSIPLRNPPLMKQCVFEYDYSLPTVKSLYSNCYEFYFDEPIDLLPNYDTYIGTTWCGFPDKRMTLGLDTSRSQEWYGGCYTGSIIPGYVEEYPYNICMEKQVWRDSGKVVEYYKVPGYEDKYWDDCYWGIIFPILNPRCTAPRCMQIVSGGERPDTVRWCGDAESEVFQVSLAGYPASPDSGMITTVTDTSFALPDTLPDTVCVAYVRKMCTLEFATHTDTVWGDWSAPILVAGDTTGLGGGNGGGGDTTGIVRADRQTAVTLTPNPTSGKVTVSSTERMTTLEVFDAAGAPVLRRNMDSHTATLNTTAWPKGTYMVRLTTAKGVATRKLVVQ